MAFTLSNAWFKFLHSHFLIYTICWEDAHIDRKLLELNSESNVLMITSAGCNALEYLLDGPSSIHCVDVNPKQTALIELKLALIRKGIYRDFFSFFGEGKLKSYKEIYSQVRTSLSPRSQSVWDNQLHFFKPNGTGFFHHGGAGVFARFLNRSLQKKGIRNKVFDLIYEPDVTIREKLYDEIEQKLWSGLEQYLWKTPWILSLAGVPKSQINAAGDLNGFMRHALRNIFVNQHAKENPYWRLYLERKYEHEFLPMHLREEVFEILRSEHEKINCSTSDLIFHLEQSNTAYSHFVLLDHMDWLVGKHDDILEKQWEEIISHATSKAKILFRTAHPDLDFISKKVKKRIHFEHISPRWIAQNDRVGTYTGTYLGTVK